MKSRVAVALSVLLLLSRDEGGRASGTMPGDNGIGDQLYRRTMIRVLCRWAAWPLLAVIIFVTALSR
jgi:preprotein translocase subunit SecG